MSDAPRVINVPHEDGTSYVTSDGDAGVVLVRKTGIPPQGTDDAVLVDEKSRTYAWIRTLVIDTGGFGLDLVVSPKKHHLVKFEDYEGLFASCAFTGTVHPLDEVVDFSIKGPFLRVLSSEEIRVKREKKHSSPGDMGIARDPGFYWCSIDVYGIFPKLNRDRHYMLMLQERPWVLVSCPHKRACFLVKITS